MEARKRLAILLQDGFKVYSKMAGEFTLRWTSLLQDILPILLAPPAWIIYKQHISVCFGPRAARERREPTNRRIAKDDARCKPLAVSYAGVGAGARGSDPEAHYALASHCIRPPAPCRERERPGTNVRAQTSWAKHRGPAAPRPHPTARRERTAVGGPGSFNPIPSLIRSILSNLFQFPLRMGSAPGRLVRGRRQWYPVAWERDLPAGVPVKVTLFDEDFVVVRGRERDAKKTYSDGVHLLDEPIALVDKCPHRLAALSEGRAVFTPESPDNAGAGSGSCSTISVQCAYHGWKFDGASGAAVDVPRMSTSGGAPPPPTLCATAVPARRLGGLVWVFPSPSPKLGEAPLPPIPVPPEMLSPDFVKSPVVRDIPVDFTVLLENVMDFDHGPFAHQALAFDLYSGSREHPQRVRVLEEEESVAPFTIEMRTAAVEGKLPKRILPQSKKDKPAVKPGAPKKAPKPVKQVMAAPGDAVAAAETAFVAALAAEKSDHTEANETEERGSSGNDGEAFVLQATSTFSAPCQVVSGRRDPNTGKSNFMNAFWVVPTGVGRCRFMSCAIIRKDILPPGLRDVFLPPKRWSTHLGILQFLDQDTCLLVSEQPHVLRAELAAAEAGTTLNPKP